MTAQRGELVDDEQRFRALFDAHYAQIARYFVNRGRTDADADDLVAATFEVAWRQLKKVPSGEGAVPWLYGVARNQLRNAWRKAQREAAFVDDMGHAMATVAELPLEQRAAAAETMQALARLKREDRELVLLVTWDELSPSEAGRALGLRPNAARTRLHRARRRLAEMLDTPVTEGPHAD
ncbi:MAG: RNA polymerase sigma factor [Solirubrobacteraceae bacterium]